MSGQERRGVDWTAWLVVLALVLGYGLLGGLLGPA